MFANIFFLLLSIKYIKIICINYEPQINYMIDPGNLAIYMIDFQNKQMYNFGFPDSAKCENDLIVHLYSINCNIEIIFDEYETISRKLPNSKDKDKNMYSFIINKNYIPNYTFTILTLINNLNKNKTCPLVINTIEMSKEPSLLIKDKSPIILFFDQYLTNVNLKYPFGEIETTKFAFFSFSFQEITFFEINVYGEKQNLLKKSIISSSSTLFLTKELNNNNEFIINIKHNDKYKIANSSLLKYELISNYDLNYPKLLEENYLNKDFITSNLEYKYFYAEIKEGQGGEIMLHDKRDSGILIGLIEEKASFINRITEQDIYPKINSYNKNKYLNYNQHLNKLSFNFDETKKCVDGCYILISYYHEKINFQKIDELVGFEFTLLLRIWDNDIFRAQIINIPFNEYIMGCFEENSVKEHYYSIYLSNQTDKINIEVIGESIKGFWVSQVKKRITNKYDNAKELNLNFHYRNIIEIETDKIKNNYISFSFKPKREEEKLSFYYFRIVQSNKDDFFIFPLDSNLENFCKPQEIPELNFCIYILRNDYNEFLYHFSIFPSNQNQFILLNYKRISKSDNYIIDPKNISELVRTVNTTQCEEPVFNFINKYEQTLNDLEYIIFIISYDNSKYDQIFGLHSTFYNGKKEIFPNIYSSEIFQSSNITKYINFSLEYNFSLTFNWLNGEGIANLNNYFVNQTIDSNYLGKYYKIPIMENGNNIVFYEKNSFIFWLKLEYSRREEFISLENTLNKFVQNEDFPLYFILPNKDNDENIFINFKIMNLNIEDDINFEIQGKIIYDSDLTKNNQENKDFSNSIKGEYDICTKIGILNINIKDNKLMNPNHIIREKNYIYIKVSFKDYNEKNRNIFIQILAIKKNSDLLIPINQYILRPFSSKDESHNYKIFYNKMQNKIELENKNVSKEEKYNIIIEILGNDNLPKLNFLSQNISLENSDDGKYILNINTNGDEIDFTINCTNLINNNESLIGNYYMLRYYSKEETEEDIKYELNTESIQIENNQISLDNIKVIGNNYTNNNITFIIYFNLFEKDDIINQELLKVLTPIKINPKYTNKVRVDSQEEKINATLDYDINNNHIIQIKVNVIKNSDYFYTKNLVYVYNILSNLNNKNNDFDTKLLLLIITITAMLLIFLILIVYVFYIKKKNKSLEEILQTSFVKKDEDTPQEDENVSFI